MVGPRAGKPECLAGMFLETLEATEDPGRGESNNRDSTCDSLWTTPLGTPLYSVWVVRSLQGGRVTPF